MRIRTAAIILLVAAMALTANMLVGDRTLSPAQLEKVRTVCPECHGEVPEYDRVSKVHRKHAAFDCNFCHGDRNGLKTMDIVHKNLQRVGIGAMLLALLGIVMNIFVIRRRAKAN